MSGAQFTKFTYEKTQVSEKILVKLYHAEKKSFGKYFLFRPAIEI
jgi:hypothetical protein